MTIAFVLGNGVSRRGLPLEHIQTLGKIYGCNALYRDFIPDVLVATDPAISKAIQASGYANQHVFYTRKPVEGLGAQRVPEPYYGYSSGPIAIALAALDQQQRIYLLGFDMGPNKYNQFNNIYQSTEFYKPAGSVPTYTGNWMRQLVKIAKDFRQTQFIRVCGDTTAQLPELESISNLAHEDLLTFQMRINKQKDL